jgi:hypothetical protein
MPLFLKLLKFSLQLCIKFVVAGAEILRAITSLRFLLRRQQIDLGLNLFDPLLQFSHLTHEILRPAQARPLTLFHSRFAFPLRALNIAGFPVSHFF